MKTNFYEWSTFNKMILQIKIKNRMMHITQFLKTVGISIFFLILAVTGLHAQNPTYFCDLRNDVQVDARTFEYDIYFLRTGTIPWELTNFQFGVNLNPLAVNGGTITVSLVSGTSELLIYQVPVPAKLTFTASKNSINITATPGPGVGSGTIISDTGIGTRVGRIRIKNSVDFGSVRPNLTWGFSISIVNVITKVAAYANGGIPEITVQSSHRTINLANAVLNASSVPPDAFAVTGGGSYCYGGPGLPVGIANSAPGVTYTLINNGVTQAPTVAGTGAAISFGNQLTGTYTVSGTTSGGVTVMTGSAVITENAAISTPTGNPTQSICAGNSPIIASLSATGTAIQWYAAPTGGTALLSSTALVNGAQYYASQTIGGCESPIRLGVTVTLTPAPTGAATQTFCLGSLPIVVNLTATGTAIQWYLTSSGGSALPATTALTNGTHYFASQTVGGCESITRFEVTVTVNPTPAAPTGSVSQSFCTGALPTVANLAATGTAIKWYTTLSGGTALATSVALSDGIHYYASQMVNGCESSARLDVAVTVYLTPGAPTGTANQSICSGTSATIAGLTATGTSVKWYSASSGGAALLSTAAVTNGTHYYASQTVNGCESSLRFDVTVTITAPPTGVAAQSFCSVDLPSVANLVATGTTILWYSAPNGGTALSTSYLLSNGSHYYASQTINGCESILRFDVTATIKTTPAAPTGTAAQTFCSGASPIVGNLTATGTLIQWYSAITGGIALPPSTVLVNGSHYYGSQTVSNCESSARIDVTATVNVSPGAPTGAATQSFCSGTSPTIASLGATGTAIKWYSASSGGSALATSAVLVTGTHYFASQTTTGCESITRLDVTAIVTTSLPASVSIGTSANPVCTGTSVTFTAIPVVGGAAPTYQWYKNSVAVTTGATYTYIPGNGDIVYAVMTSNAPCATGSPVTSNSITMVVNSFVDATISVGVSQNTVCAGTSVTFTPSPVGGGAAPTYQWIKNSIAVSTGSSYSYVPVNGDVVNAVMTSSLACATGSPATSNSIAMIVNLTIPASVTAAVDKNSVCAGTSVTLTATPVGGGTSPAYQWYKNNIAVTTGLTYTYIPLNNDVVRVVMTSNATCATGNPATSNSITMLVNPIIPASVSSTVSQNNVCSGTSVTFLATPVGGGTPTFQWFKNSVAVSTGLSYNYAPVDGDVVHVIMTSNATCASGSPATSNSITMGVKPLVAAAGPITGSPLFTQGTTGVSYSVATIANATSYIWAYSGTGVTINGNGTNVSLDFSSSATSGQITVKGRNSCGDGPQSFINFLGAKTLSLTSILLEGLYNGGGTMRQARDAAGPHWPGGIADHITVELHSGTSFSTIVYSQADVPLSISGTAEVTVPGNISNSYYITIKHRNSLETTSATPVSFAGTIINQSFGTPAKVFGGNVGLSADLGHYLIYAGDVNQDGIINTQDYIGVDSDSYNYVTGYLATDVDGNGTIDTNDYISIDNNNYNHIGVIHP